MDLPSDHLDPFSKTNEDVHRSPPHVRAGWWLMMLVALVLYAGSCATGPQWQDSGAHILRVVKGELWHPLGLALIHPLHHFLGRATVFLTEQWVDPAHAVTMVGAVFGAITVANVFGCVATWTRRRSAAFFAAASLMLAHTFWQFSTRTETYTVTTAALTGELWCLILFLRTNRKHWALGMFFLNGLGISNHLLASLTTPVLILATYRHRILAGFKIKDMLAFAGLWLVGTLPYTVLVLIQLFDTGNIYQTIKSSLFGRYYANSVMNTTIHSGYLLTTIAFLAYSFPNLLLPAALYGQTRGLQKSEDRRIGYYLLIGLAIHLLFVFRYSVIDQYTFLIPSYTIICIFGGFGVSVFMDHHPRLTRGMFVLGALLLVTTPAFYFLATTTARRLDLLEHEARNKPYRDDYVYLLIPWSGADRSAERMSHTAVGLANQDGLILAEDQMGYFAIAYALHQMKDNQTLATTKWTDKTILDGVAENRTIILIPANTQKAPQTPPIGRWVPHDQLYVLETEQ